MGALAPPSRDTNKNFFIFVVSPHNKQLTKGQPALYLAGAGTATPAKRFSVTA
jgi:hypothetical protein